MKKINAPQAVLSGVTSEVKTINIHIRNQGSQTEIFGVYVDIVPPGGITNPFGCTPSGRILSTTVTLAPSTVDTVINVTPTFSCADQAGAFGQTYQITAAVDVHADDEGACGVFQIGSLGCFNALADDDSDDTDNRIIRNALQVHRP